MSKSRRISKGATAQRAGETTTTRKSNSTAQRAGEITTTRSLNTRNSIETSDRSGDRREKSNLEKFTTTAPQGSSSPSVSFPSGSASAVNLKAFNITPGLDNYIELQTPITTGVNLGPQIHLSASAEAKRTANGMVLEFVPTFGSIGRIADFNPLNPLTIAGLRLKQFVDTSYGTRNDYDPQDLIMYLMGVAAVFPVIAEIKRDLRLVYTASTYPNFLPYGLIKGLRLHTEDESSSLPEDVVREASTNLHRYVDTLNQLIQTFNMLPKPPEFLIFGYNDDLYDALYADTEDLDNAQLFAFTSSGSWIYDEDSDENSICLEYNTWFDAVDTTTGTSIAAKLSRLWSQVSKLSALRSNSNVMLQNLFNAYGSKDSEMVQLFPIDMPSKLPIVYDKRMLTSIENAVLTGNKMYMGCYYTEGLHNGITGGPIMNAATPGDFTLANFVNVPLQFHKPASDITDDDIGDAMRFHPIFANYEFTSYKSSAPRDAVSMPSGHAWDYSGFAYITIARTVYLSNSCTWESIEYHNRLLQSYVQANALLDFQHAPLLVDVSMNGSWTDATVEFQIKRYTGHRDVELPYRLADAKMFYLYLTSSVWAANVDRNVTGSRR